MNAATLSIPITTAKNITFNATVQTDTSTDISRFYRRIGIQTSGTSVPKFHIQASLDGVNWGTLPEELVHNDSPSENIIPEGGGLVYLEVPVPTFIRLFAPTAQSPAAPDCNVQFMLYGMGEVGKSARHRD
jgi:hypothetical protein